jgi:hypothetical protein
MIKSFLLMQVLVMVMYWYVDDLAILQKRRWRKSHATKTCVQ